MNPKLSICITTFNRGDFIVESLDTIMPQLTEKVELILVNGNSPDNTDDVIQKYLRRYPIIQYYKESENSGVDKDYNKAVEYAKGDYCWLMTDDDLMAPDAIEVVLAHMNKDFDLIIANTMVKNVDFSIKLNDSIFGMQVDKIYKKEDRAQFLAEAANGLSFIGSVIINRQFWMKRNREKYFGTLFIHVGVIFQQPSIENILFIGKPLLTIRYGNAMWAARGFEIWMFKWPELIWSFEGFTDKEKYKVSPKYPWLSVKQMMLSRSFGSYSISEYNKFFKGKYDFNHRVKPLLIALMSAKFQNTLLAILCFLFKKKSRTGLYDLVRSPHATSLTKLIGKKLGISVK